MIANLKRFRKRSFRQSQSKFPKIFFGLVLLTLLGFLAVSNWKIYKKRTELNSGIEILSQKLQELESANQELKEKISDIPGKDYLEKVAREKFNLKKPGEEVVVIKKEKGNATPTEIQEQNNAFSLQNWLNPIREFFSNGASWLKSKFKLK